MILDCNNEPEWLKTLYGRYDKHKVKFNDSEKGTTALFYPSSHNRGGHLVVGRFNKVTGTGVVFCRRDKDKPVKYDRRKK